MPTQILMPALSPTMEEGNLVKWLVAEGDTVRAGDILAEIETDKATMEFESIDDGVVGKILVEEGTEGVKVNDPIAVLLAEGEDAGDMDAAPAASGGKASSEKTTSSATAPDKAEDAAKAPAKVSSSGNGAVKATPLARRMADQAGIDIDTLTPTGPGGKVVKADIERAMGGGSNTSAGNGADPGANGRVIASPLARRMAREAKLPLERIEGSGPHGRIVKRDIERVQRDGLPDYELIPHTSMRKTIARRLTQSKQTVPHFYLTVDVELDNLLEVRKQINANAPEGVKISVNDFVIKAAAMALIKVPDANAAYTEEGLLKFDSADISVAVAIPGGLITPIIRGAHAKGLAEISAEMADLAKRARDGKLKPMEFTGGTFSISNLGMFGIKQFDAVINPPQGAILAVGAGEPRPVVKNGQLAVATVMSCTLSVDHRVIDGALGAQYLAAFKPFIENPALMLL